MSARRILVIDDSAFTAHAIGWALRRAGFDVQIARDLWELEGDASRPDLVFVDVVLQEAFGDDVAMLLRTTRGLDCPILLMSSLPDAELAQRSADAGLDGFVAKREGLTAFVERARQLLGDGVENRAGADEVSARFVVSARQRALRALHVAARPSHWNAAALVAEMHALSGDAELVRATAIADAAKTCRDTVERHGTAGWTAAIGAAIEEVGKLVGAGTAPAAKVLVVGSGQLEREQLLAGFDAAGHVVVEAETLAQARQKLRAADYQLIVLDGALDDSGSALVGEIRALAPDARLAILGGHATGDAATVVLARELGAERLLVELRGLLGR